MLNNQGVYPEKLKKLTIPPWDGSKASCTSGSMTPISNWFLRNWGYTVIPPCLAT